LRRRATPRSVSAILMHPEAMTVRPGSCVGYFTGFTRTGTVAGLQSETAAHTAHAEKTRVAAATKNPPTKSQAMPPSRLIRSAWDAISPAVTAPQSNNIILRCSVYRSGLRSKYRLKVQSS
jgi:hypothetical protein